MMTSLAQAYSPHPGGMQQHPGMAQGHPMGVPHNPQQGQPGPNMQQQMQMGVSGPGPQVSQGGAMMGGMPPGAGGPSQHALHHLNPNQAQQAQFLQQQQAMFASNPQLQQMQQQQIIQHQRQQQAQRQAMLAQQYSGMPVGMTNGMNQMTQAQFQAMRGNPMRPVNLPQHLQAQQQQVAEHNSLQQQQQQQAQAQAQHHHQQQLMMAQQMALAQQAQAGNGQGQPGQMNPQQAPNPQAQNAMMQQAQAHQQQQQQAQAAAAAQQNQGQNQGQVQAQPGQQPQQNAQPQSQQPQQMSQQQQQPNMQQAAAMMQQQQQRQQGEKIRGQCLMKLMQFGDHLSNFGSTSKSLSSYMVGGVQRLAAQATKQLDDLNYWHVFVQDFFSSKGVLRHSLWVVDETTSSKQFEIPFPALARYFHTHFESGVRKMQMIVERGNEKELTNNTHYIESQKSSFVYWFDNGSQLVANGTLKAYFDAEQRIELLEFITNSHEEFLPRNQVVTAARPLHEWTKEWKQLNTPSEAKSPEMNKKSKAKAIAMKSPPQAPPQIDLPDSFVKASTGITPMVFRFFELVEVMGMMNPIFGYSHQNSSLTPYTALDRYVLGVTANGANNNGQQPNPSGPRTPGMNNFAMGASPAPSHLVLPDGSPRPQGSPAQAPGMQLQQSQHGTSSSGPSANTSPNASNKRRRPSTVKAEEENQQSNGASKTAVKPSPRIGGKRQKGNPA